MKITVHLEKERTKQEVEFDGTNVSDLLNSLKINPETVLVTCNNEVLTESEILEDSSTVEILSVISGG